MKISFDDIFKYSDILNPISSATLLRAGKLANLESNTLLLDLGSGKGSPSLLWASLFGIHVEGYDFALNFVQYANSRAQLLNLSHRVKFFCKDINDLKITRTYNAMAFLGLGAAHIFGSIPKALKQIRAMLSLGGILFFAEPVWLAPEIPLNIQERLGAVDEHFLTKSELLPVIEQGGFQVKGSFDSSKEDWALYVQPVTCAMREIMSCTKELADEAQMVLHSFQAEYEAAEQYWNMVLWVVKAI